MQISPVNRNMDWIFNMLHNIHGIGNFDFNWVWGWDVTMENQNVKIIKIASLEFWSINQLLKFETELFMKIFYGSLLIIFHER